MRVSILRRMRHRARTVYLVGLTWTAIRRRCVVSAVRATLQPVLGRRVTFVWLVGRAWMGVPLLLVSRVLRVLMPTSVPLRALTACLVSLTLTSVLRLPARHVLSERTPVRLPRHVQHVTRAGLMMIAQQPLRVTNARLANLHLRMRHSAQSVLVALLI